MDSHSPDYVWQFACFADHDEGNLQSKGDAGAEDKPLQLRGGDGWGEILIIVCLLLCMTVCLPVILCASVCVCVCVRLQLT